MQTFVTWLKLITLPWQPKWVINTNPRHFFFFFHFLFKRFSFFVAVPYIKVAELTTRLGDAKHEECLCLVLKRHSAALWLHEHILYFGMTPTSFSTQGWLIWEGTGLWRRRLLWVTCPEFHWCHWCGCHIRSSQDSERWGRGMLCWRNRCSPPCLGSGRAHWDFFLFVTHCVLYFSCR